MRKVFVRIDRVVLHGGARADEEALVQALQEELTRELGAITLATRVGALGNIARLDAGRVTVQAPATPQEIGKTAGSAIAGRLAREG